MLQQISRLLMLVLLCLFQTAFGMQQDSTQRLLVKADIIALDESVALQFPNALLEEYFVVITLSNPQDTATSIHTMTCSWEESFVFDNDGYILSYPGCDKNFPTTIELQPHKAIQFFGKLRRHKKSKSDAGPPSCKIGFVDLPLNNYGSATLYARTEKMRSTIYWSEVFNLRGKLYSYEVESNNSEH